MGKTGPCCQGEKSLRHQIKQTAPTLVGVFYLWLVATNDWTILGEKAIYENPWIQLTEFDVINPGGGKGIYGKVHFKNIAVGVVALSEQQEIVLVGQYRFTLDQYSWEIPEGGCPLHEDPLTAAQRELLEETGLKAHRWQCLFRMHLSNSVSDELGVVFLATDLEQGQAQPEQTENLSLKWVSLDQALAAVEKGEITDSMSVAALYKIQLLRVQGQIN